MLHAFDLGPANLQLISNDDLLELLREIHTRVGSPVSAIGLGMAGLRNDTDHERVTRLIHTVWPGVPLRASHDLESAMMATGPLRKDIAARILLLSGTGSKTFGKDHKGRTAKFGGRGHILGDQGSACDIALTALRRIAYEQDRRHQFPALGRALLRATQLNEPDDLIAWTQEASKDEIARLAVTIFEEAKRHDRIARQAGHS